MAVGEFTILGYETDYHGLSPEQFILGSYHGHNGLVFRLVAPRFDTVTLVLVNAATIALSLAVLVSLVRRQRSDDPPAWWMWALVLVNASVGGIYLPIGPMLVLLNLEAPQRTTEPRESVPHQPRL